MKTLKSILLVGIIFWQSTLVFCQTNTKNSTVLRGPYMGQTPPGNQSKVFAPKVVSTEFGELNAIFTRDGSEFYFSRRGIQEKPSAIMVSRMVNNVWTKPEHVDFTGTYDDIDLFITPDGLSLIFCSNRPHRKGDDIKRDHDFWISKRKGTIWTEPLLYAKAARSDYEDFFPIVTKSGNLYFNSQRGGQGTNDIFCSKFIDGKYNTAKKLPMPINTEYREFDAYVTPDEKTIIFSSVKPGGFGGADIYLSWKNNDGKWIEPRNMGSEINSAGSEYGSTISPDGKYFFYTSNKNGSEDIYWISAKIIEEVKQKETK
jgi:hypothetical protein